MGRGLNQQNTTGEKHFGGGNLWRENLFGGKDFLKDSLGKSLFLIGKVRLAGSVAQALRIFSVSCIWIRLWLAGVTGCLAGWLARVRTPYVLAGQLQPLAELLIIIRT